MKTKTTKLSVLAFLGLGLVAYGQDYSGKIGINYNKPNATLEIKGKSDNTDKTLEGLIIPNVSKNKAYLMTTNTEMPLKESTLIYVDNISDYTTSPVDTKVADITEKGYYFWNGTKWVKTVGSISGNTGGGLWAERFNTSSGLKETYLVSANNDGLKYDYDKTGLTLDFINPTGSTDTFDTSATISSYGFFSTRFHNHGYGPSLALSGGRGQKNNPLDSQAGDVLGRIYFNPVLKGSTHGYGAVIQTKLLEVKSPDSFSTNLTLGARGIGETTPYYTMVLTETNRVGIGTANPESRLQVIGEIRGNGLRTDGAETMGGMLILQNPKKTGDNQVERWVFSNTNAADTSWGSYRDGLSLWKYNKNSTEGVSNPVLFISDKGAVGIGPNYVYSPSSPDNYPMTERLNVDGAISARSLLGDGIRNVVADANGKLIIGNESNGGALSKLWSNDSTTKLVKLINISDGLTPRTESNRVTIADDGAITAKSFIGYNGATIFPDYVFQKYYTGTSSIKSDYNFKTLSQVEDFVKTNGHLPGYLSASKIKEQGYIDLMATQLTNVEKIEELYLHLLEKDKEVKELKERLEKLEKLLQK
ncbi:hypothetical protein [Riemerella anatipestifer]|uniref:hypothetical protein n=1 Tax=Riemerella anatipestifer TaxID=34085 RepID=UPI0030ED2B4F